MDQKIDPKLIAPCGMNCAVCSMYLAFRNKTPKRKGIRHCEGCRPRNRECGIIKKKCKNRRKMLKGEIEFCYDCDFFPCDGLNHLDSRYRKHYGMSMIDNLEEIRNGGLANFLDAQYAKYKCSRCGRLKSVHNGKCFKCDTIISWKE